MARMQEEATLLRDVSRSFYLSISALPAEMRPAVSAGYLLARATDSVADATGIALHRRIELLEKMRAAIAGESEWQALPDEICRQADTAAEAQLLSRFGEILQLPRKLPDPQPELLRGVLDTILKGQQWDLSFFEEHNCVLSDEQTKLYTYRVAGCVGRFWTQLGLCCLGEKFCDPSQAEALQEAAARYGCGLQLVNILRDREEDKRRGRSYLCSDPEEWMQRAERYLRTGVQYARSLRSFRVRFASLLPALLGLKTLAAIRRTKPGKRAKISRSAVYATMLRAFCRSLVNEHRSSDATGS